MTTFNVGDTVRITLPKHPLVIRDMDRAINAFDGQTATVDYAEATKFNVSRAYILRVDGYSLSVLAYADEMTLVKEAAHG